VTPLDRLWDWRGSFAFDLPSKTKEVYAMHWEGGLVALRAILPITFVDKEQLVNPIIISRKG